MKTPLAWRNLVHNKVRTLVAVAGVAFAVVLVFMQLGFQGAVVTTATLIYRALDFDVLLRSADYLHFADARVFPRNRLPLASSTPGVVSVVPFYVQMTQWHNRDDGLRRAILVMGVDPDRPGINHDELRAETEKLTRLDFALIDRESDSAFGPANGVRFGDEDVGRSIYVGDAKLKIVGHYALGSGFAADGALVVSDRGFAQIHPSRTIEDVTFGLVKIKDDIAPEQVVNQLRHRLPPDVEVLARSEVEKRETKHWLNDTPIGLIFQMGAWIAVIVGVAIVYQVLSSDVEAHAREYATLRAMGYADKKLARVVLEEAIILAFLGFVPGLVVALVLYRTTSMLANIPIDMTLARVIGVLLLTLGMCAASGIAALRKIWSADPAELF